MHAHLPRNGLHVAPRPGDPSLSLVAKRPAGKGAGRGSAARGVPPPPSPTAKIGKQTSGEESNLQGMRA